MESGHHRLDVVEEVDHQFVNFDSITCEWKQIHFKNY